MKSFWRNNGLSVVMFGLFGLFLAGQALAGWSVSNDDRGEHGLAAVSLGTYLLSGHFIEAVFENWESEFLQMGAYVLLTVYLFQKGSAESKEPGKFGQVGRPPHRVASWLYRNSLGLALFGIFAVSFALHGLGGWQESCSEARMHHEACESVMGYMTSNQFWFESLQNWQSEFLAVGALVLLSIWLRQQGSPESKAVGDPNDKTG
jgi:hypothetical protein